MNRNATAERKRNLTKEKIVVEGAKVFNKRGYYGTTLDDIAGELEVTKAALYYHIRSKEEILYECHKAGLDVATLAVEKAVQDSAAPDDQLWIAISYFIEYVTDRLHGAVVLIEEGSLTGKRRKEIFCRRDEWEGEIRKIIQRGVSQGIFVDCDPKLIGFAILGAINWVNKWYDPAGSYSGREIGEAFASFLTRGIMK